MHLNIPVLNFQQKENELKSELLKRGKKRPTQVSWQASPFFFFRLDLFYIKLLVKVKKTIVCSNDQLWGKWTKDKIY